MTQLSQSSDTGGGDVEASQTSTVFCSQEQAGSNDDDIGGGCAFELGAEGQRRGAGAQPQRQLERADAKARRAAEKAEQKAAKEAERAAKKQQRLEAIEIEKRRKVEVREEGKTMRGAYCDK